MTLKNSFLKILFLFITLQLTACGGGSDDNNSTPAQLEGQFVDSLVIGLRYETPTLSGFTNAQGKFNYRLGEQVSFYVGDILIGTSTGQAIITPIELVIGATDETNIQVQNIALFLQSIDDDGDESNGINITALTNGVGAGASIDFTLASSAFDTDGAIETLISLLTAVNGDARILLPRSQIIDNLNANLLVLISGVYQGSFSGDDTGSWIFTVDVMGRITGSFTSNTSGLDDISGSISSNGQSNIQGNAGTATFSGGFKRDGSVGGTWDDGVEGNGTFTGKRTSAIVIPGTLTPTNPNIESGSLSVSGNDSAIIGTTFSPNVAPLESVTVLPFDSGNVIVIAWGEDFTSANSIGSRRLTLTSTGDNSEPNVIGYTFLLLQNNVISAYTYSIDCETTPANCASITLDINQKSVSFNNTILTIDESEDAIESGPISLSGTLNW